MQFQSPLLNQIPGITHAFGTKPQPTPKAFTPFKNTPSFSWKQVHGNHIVEISSADQQPGEADGFWTRLENVPAKVHTADCVPILLARKDGSTVGAIHAGWRGLLSHILESFWEQTAESPSDWMASIGPSVNWCCYELEKEIAHQFENEFKEIDMQSYAKESSRGPEYVMFDPSRLAREILRSIPELEFDQIDKCTYCSTHSDQLLFFSHRRRTHQKLDEGRICQASVIMRTN